MNDETKKIIKQQIAAQCASVARKGIGENINRTLGEKGVTQTELAAKTGISVSCIKDILSGKNHSAGIDQYLKIAYVLDIDLGILMSTVGPRDYLREGMLEGDFFHGLVEEEVSMEPDAEAIKEEKIEDIRDASFYPARIGNHKVSSLAEFLVYLPLIDVQILWDILQNRMGSAGPFCQEEYVLKKIDYLIGRIPDSPAKKYADDYCDLIHKYMASKNRTIKYECYELLNEDDRLAYEEILNREESRKTIAKRVFNAIVLHDLDFGGEN